MAAERHPRPRAVVVLSPWFPNTPKDWKFTYIYDSAAALTRLGLAVHVLVCRPFTPPFLDFLAPEWTRGRIETGAFEGLASLTAIYYPGLPGGRLRRVTNVVASQRIGRALKSLAVKSGAELVHAHTEGLALIASGVARQLDLPSVVTLHGLNTDPQFLHEPAQRAIFRRALNSTDRVILVGKPLWPFFSTLVGRDDHFRVIHNGVRFPRDLDRGPILRPSQPIRFIAVSNLHEGKGVDVALRALALARDAGFEHWDYTIVGEGSERAALVDLSQSLGLAERVRFLGAHPHDKVFEFLSEADIFVLPSYREAFGISYLEAMAAGLVTIGVRGQGPEAFIEDGKSGFLVEPKSPRSLADCILGIVAQQEAARRIGAAGMKLVRSAFTWDAHATRLTEVYRELASR
ncbi:MAG TPA: glycosyltransferase [Gemmataceae bacterium]|nr:glycosyltransferase [Gemmataceae bacterium]